MGIYNLQVVEERSGDCRKVIKKTENWREEGLIQASNDDIVKFTTDSLSRDHRSGGRNSEQVCPPQTCNEFMRKDEKGCACRCSKNGRRSGRRHHEEC